MPTPQHLRFPQPNNKLLNIGSRDSDESRLPAVCEITVSFKIFFRKIFFHNGKAYVFLSSAAAVIP